MIFMIIYEKTPNHSNGALNAKTALVGELYPIPTKGNLTLKSIEEAMGKNNKPVVLLNYERGVTAELPDYGIEKLRDGKE
jgi:hypothetical protein